MATVVKVPLDQIIEPEVDLRTQVSEEGLRELASSIRQIGVINPITLIRRGGKYEIKAGFRRFTAARMAGLAAIPGIVLSKNYAFLEEVTIHENLYREDVSDVDYAQYFDYLQGERGWSQERIAQAVGKSMGFVQQRLALLKGDKRVLAALQGNRISFSVARELVGVEDPEDLGRFLKLAIENGVTDKVVRIWKQSARVAGQTSPSPNQTYAEPEPGPSTTKIVEPCFLCGEEVSADHLFGVKLCETCRRTMLEQIGEGQGSTIRRPG